MNDRLDSTEIIKVLSNLIGRTEAVGESHTDEVRLKNLKTLIDITNWCLSGILLASATCGRPEASMHEIGWTAKCALGEYAEWLKRVTEED